MDDFSDLAARIGTSVGELRGVLILSRDGLVLGSFPDDDAATKPAWIRFATVGDPEKAFVEFGDELWAYVRRGPYAAFAVAGVAVRPGLLLEQLEQAILVAEEARSKRESLRVPEAPEAPKGKPRTPLHPEPKKAKEPEPLEEPVVVHAEATTSTAAAAGGEEPSPQATVESAAEAQAASAEAPEAEAQKGDATPSPAESGAAKTGPPDAQEGGEVDRVLLAQEFSRLLQETGSNDEETP
jgi:hypothetical protein